MINNFECTNIYTTDTNGLAQFYNNVLGIPIQFEGFGNFDGAKIGFSRTEPGIVIWDKNKWGKVSTGPINFIFSCDNLEDTYQGIKEKGVNIEPPVTMEWGKELILYDPEGNKVTILEQRY